MLAPISSGRRDKQSSFKSLLRYLTKEKDPKTREERLRGIVVTNGVLTLETAAIEMKAVADQNKLCGDPVYHYQITWRPGERPTQEQWEEAARRTLEALGFTDHQYIVVSHDDRKHFHIHVMVNRIHPDTYKAHAPYYDMPTLDKTLREIEHEQNWSEDVGTYRWDREQDKAVANTWEEREQLSRAAKRARGKAAELEHYQGEESLESYAKGAPARDLKALLERDQVSWQDVHALLRKHGLEIYSSERGGYTVGAIDSEIRVKASEVFRGNFAGKVNRAATEQKLGPWQEPAQEIRARTAEQSYGGRSKREPEKRWEQREARQQQRRELKTEFNTYRNSERARQKAYTAEVATKRKELDEGLKRTKKQIRSRPIPWIEKRGLLSRATAEVAIRRRQLKAEAKRERLKMQPMTYQQWVMERAEKGDKRAAAQLRGWRYQDQRNIRKLEKAIADNTIEVVHLFPTGDRASAIEEEWQELTNDRLKAVQKSEELAKTLGATRWTIDRRTGDTSYTIAGKLAVIDQGRMLSVVGTDDAALVLALEMASIKYGRTLTATGPEQWRERIARAAVGYDINVEFADPQMQQWVEDERSQRRAKQDKEEILRPAVEKHSMLNRVADTVATQGRALLTEREAAIVYDAVVGPGRSNCFYGHGRGQSTVADMLKHARIHGGDARVAIKEFADLVACVRNGKVQVELVPRAAKQQQLIEELRKGTQRQLEHETKLRLKRSAEPEHVKERTGLGLG